jgi:hypothetical protein
MDETAPPRRVSEGTIDHIFVVLSKYTHPFILVGIVGCAGGVDEGFDLLIRNDQLGAIAANLIATGPGLCSTHD